MTPDRSENVTTAPHGAERVSVEPAARQRPRSALSLILESVGMCGAIGVVVLGIPAACAAIGTTLVVPPGVMVSGEIAGGLVGAGAGAIAGGVIGLCVGAFRALSGPVVTVAGPR